ncbi:MAG TPA: hypothetical protein VFN92_03655 [Solirubrobacterales bacterium]|nr:hypothetical protein [Solirubrobacterales bacterium]
METIVVAGALAAKPGNGGEAWVRLSWVLGLRRLGYDAWLLEEADPGTARDGRRFFRAEAERHGLGERAVLLGDEEEPLGRDAVEDLARSAVALVDISGNLREPGLRERFRRRAYVDLDPGFTQIWHSQGLLGDQLDGYDRHFTVGLNLGGEGCSVPLGGIEWVPLPPPVLLDRWRPDPDPGSGRFTTVATWRNPLGRLEADGRAFTLKHHQLRRFAALPGKVEASLEIALGIHPDEAAEAERLREAGWAVVDPAAVAGDSESYREYVRGSAAELSVTQGVYAEALTGWISDRSAHYLAAGRPAVVQETGSPPAYRDGGGLLTFADLDGAAAAVDAVLADYEGQRAAARRLAERCFDSDLVLGRMLEELGAA